MHFFYHQWLYQEVDLQSGLHKKMMAQTQRSKLCEHGALDGLVLSLYHLQRLIQEIFPSISAQR